MKTTITTALMAASLLTGTAALADYPEKPVEILIPYGPGSNADTSGRILINAMRKAMDADLVPLNVAGAGGTVAMAQLAQEDADGYTIGYSPVAPLTVQPHLRPLPYDKTSFEPICMVADNPTSITVAPDSPYQTMDDLIAAAKAGEKIVAVGGAPGSIPHITQAAVAEAYGVKFIYLPAGGGAKAAKAIMGGEATLASDSSAMESVHGLRTLAVAAGERVPGLEHAPTFKELGKDIQITIWLGLFAPAGTPDDVLDTLSDACAQAYEAPEFQKGMQGANYITRFMGREEFTPFFEEEYDRNREMLSIIGVKLPQ